MNCSVASSHILLEAAGHFFCWKCGVSFIDWKNLVDRYEHKEYWRAQIDDYKFAFNAKCLNCSFSFGEHSVGAPFECPPRPSQSKVGFVPTDCTPEIKHASLKEAGHNFCFNCATELTELV